VDSTTEASGAVARARRPSQAARLQWSASNFWTYATNGASATSCTYGDPSNCANLSRMDVCAWVQLTCLGAPTPPRRALRSTFTSGPGRAGRS
jgi:hypothetical protein